MMTPEEPRWIAIGFAPGYAAELVVIHVYRYEEWKKAQSGEESEEVIRIVSARKANQSERRRFEKL